MSRNLQKVGFLHYSAPPVVGSVENVILAHVRLFSEAGYPITVVAGLLGIPVFCANTIPAANEIGGQGVIRFSPDAPPDQVASLILKWVKHRSVLRLRRHIRRDLTWHGIFHVRFCDCWIEVPCEVHQ